MSRVEWVNAPEKPARIKEKHCSYMLITYDIANPRRLRKVAHICKGYGVRVQDSVFEAYLTVAQAKRMRAELERAIDEEVDSIRVYGLRTQEPLIIMGDSELIENEQFVFIE